MVRLTLAASRQFIDLVVDNETVAGRLVTSMVVVVAGVLIAAAVGRLLARTG